MSAESERAPTHPERLAEADYPANQIPEDNPFRDIIIDLASDGHSWREILDRVDEAFNGLEEAVREEEIEYIPRFEIRMVVPDHKSTSGEAYKTIEEALDSEAKAREWATERHGAIRVESIEQVGEMGVYK